MNNAPFLTGVQQELFFLPAAARILAESGATGPDILPMLESAAMKYGLRDGHLEGLGALGAPKVDDEGYPARPPRSDTLRAMAQDCLDQMRHLELFDKHGRITRRRLRSIEDRAWLSRKVLENYRVAGQGGTRRSLVGQLNHAFLTLDDQPPEREDDPFSAVYRRGLSPPEFMWLHFWMENLPPGRRPPAEAFAYEVMDRREEALTSADLSEGGIEYAAIVMTNATTRWLLKTHERARGMLVAARSTALMLFDAGLVVPQGFPGGTQWLRPVADLKERRRKRTERQIQRAKELQREREERLRQAREAAQ